MLSRTPFSFTTESPIAFGRFGARVEKMPAADRGLRGFLFAANSTHGKSTTARLWRDQATVLNDDRIVLRRREGRRAERGTGSGKKRRRRRAL